MHNLPHHPYIVGVANSCGDWLHWTTCKPFKKEGEKKKLASSFHLQVQLAFLNSDPKNYHYETYTKRIVKLFFIYKKKKTEALHTLHSLEFPTTTKLLWIDVAFSQIEVIIVDILCPITPELWNAYLKPWLHVPIVVYNSRPLNVFLVYIGIVAETQHVPRPVQRESALPECYQTRWQCP